MNENENKNLRQARQDMTLAEADMRAELKTLGLVLSEEEAANDADLNRIGALYRAITKFTRAIQVYTLSLAAHASETALPLAERLRMFDDLLIALSVFGERYSGTVIPDDTKSLLLLSDQQTEASVNVTAAQVDGTRVYLWGLGEVSPGEPSRAAVALSRWFDNGRGLRF